MIYNEMQETVLALLGRGTGSPQKRLKPIVDAFGEAKDFHTRLIAALMNIELSEPEAETCFDALLEHHQKMEAGTGEEIDLRVAAMDFLLKHPELVQEPTIVDQAILQLTRRLAAVDELTGLFNRRFLESFLTREINRALRYEQVFSVLFLDLDDFKKINDTHGHAVGDHVLTALGHEIQELLRQEDLAARYGGEEFVIVLPQTTALGAATFGERLRQTIDRKDLVPEVHVTISGGVAAYPRHGLTVEAILKEADDALYEAKLSGKNRILTSQADKRASIRYEADIPAVAFAGDSELGPLRLCDISEDGCSIVCNDQLRPGEVLRVRVRALNDSEQQEYEVLARVVWSRAISGSGPYRIGGLWDAPNRAKAAELVKTVSAGQMN